MKQNDFKTTVLKKMQDSSAKKSNEKISKILWSLLIFFITLIIVIGITIGIYIARNGSL